MRVRGAPAIGIAAAYAVALSVMQHYSKSSNNWKIKVTHDIKQLAKSRPTAVNLFWALDKMQKTVDIQTGNPIQNIKRSRNKNSQRRHTSKFNNG